MFHGDAENSAPVAAGDELASARPDIVRYVRVAGAGHVESWNTDRDTYEAAVAGFLRDVLSSPAQPRDPENAD